MEQKQQQQQQYIFVDQGSRYIYIIIIIINKLIELLICYFRLFQIPKLHYDFTFTTICPTLLL